MMFVFLNGLPSGITGGFAPPEPEAVKSVTYAPGTKTLQITSSSSNPTQKSAEKDSSVDVLVEELESILRTIPTGGPEGGDIYGLNTSIMWGSDNLEWYNGFSQGCGGFNSVQPTDGEKAKFKRALEIANTLVAKGGGP